MRTVAAFKLDDGDPVLVEVEEPEDRGKRAVSMDLRDEALLSATLDSGQPSSLAGTISLQRGKDGATIDAETTVTVHALPKLAALFGLGVEKQGTMHARITRDGVELTPSESAPTLYRR